MRPQSEPFHPASTSLNHRERSLLEMAEGNAATQADNVALESADLEHGLLTAALILDGLVKQQADVDPRDGTVTVQKWLKYAVKRVPQLYQEAQSGKRELIVRGFGGRILGPRSRILETAPQTPVLFDFSRAQSDTVLVRTNCVSPLKPAACRLRSRSPIFQSNQA